MHLGISTASFHTRCEAEEAIDIIGSLGVDTCEVFLGSLSEFSADFGKVLAAHAGDAGVRIHSVHAMSTMFEGQLFSPPGRQRDGAFDMLRGVLACAAEAGARYYTFHGRPFFKGNNRRADYRQLAAQVTDIADVAQSMGVTVAWENVFWCQYASPDFLRSLLAAGGPDSLCATLDIKQAYAGGWDWRLYLEDMAGRLRTVHLCDRKADGSVCLPGRGVFPFGELDRALKAAGFEGPCMVEVYSHCFRQVSELAECIKDLKNITEVRS